MSLKRKLDSAPKRIGIIGYGSLGKFLCEQIMQNEASQGKLELCFVWNRTASKIGPEIAETLRLPSIEDIKNFSPDLIVEVAHPAVTREHGASLLRECNLFLGSPTAMANKELEQGLKDVLKQDSNRTLWFPTGACWGVQDIAKMAARGSLKKARVTMKKHPSSINLNIPDAPASAHSLGEQVTERLKHSLSAAEETTLYEGSVRELCPVAPNNVNTMAVCALAGIGLDATEGHLVGDPTLKDHIVIISVQGHENADGRAFQCETIRRNPAAVGAVTGSATYMSFFSSLLKAAQGTGCSGIQFC